MKKKIILVSLSLLFSIKMLQSQSLAYTIWLGTNPPSPNLFFQFGVDTISYSTGSTYVPFSVYSASNGLFNVFDLPGTMCSDTGHYNYSISSNHLVFTEISDLCVSRRNTLVNYNWNLFASGITTSTEDLISIYPNPATGGWLHYTLGNFSGTNIILQITDIDGKIIYSEKLDSKSGEIDLRNYRTGLYIGKIQSNESEYTFKILR